MDLGAIRNPLFFFGPAALFVGYLLYMMIRRRKGERPGEGWRDPEL
ncbi:MAG TPA: hypothetical protein VG406_02335 [Isosphaeraceae bacterium]|jgi:hypothetical protein|nr:hypothetical protein [Isosphaeraceae bacterium]